MRFLGIGKYCDLGALYLRLLNDGHEARVHVSDSDSHDTLKGMLDRIDDWRTELSWVRNSTDNGIILFEGADAGGVQDELRRKGYNVIGGSAFGDRLECDRAFGQEMLRSLGVKTAPVQGFTSFSAGISYIRSKPSRYVFKPGGLSNYSMDTYVGQLPDGSDVIDFMEHSRPTADETDGYILMAHLNGIEVGVGAYFNGKNFLRPACVDFEHKSFFPGDLGELTGEMGTVVSYRGAEVVFEATLAKMETLLAASGYCGYINLNTIVNEEGIWPLEFTSRFGYPGFAILDPLQKEGWGELFARLCARVGDFLDTKDGYSVGVVLTVPPFPYASAAPKPPSGLRIVFREQLSRRESQHLHYSEVALSDNRLVTAGTGQLMVVTGCGSTVREAQVAAYELAAKVAVPNLRYRLDIGDSLVNRDLARLQGWGILPAAARL